MWTFVTFVAAGLVSLLIVHGADALVVGGGLVLLTASAALLFGAWYAWAFLTLAGAGGIVVLVVMGPKWWPILVTATTLALLLAPATRRHVSPRPQTGSRLAH